MGQSGCYARLPQVVNYSAGSGLGTAHRTLPAAISRSAMTTSRLSDFMQGFAPFWSCRTRMEASRTRSKRLETRSRQSSTVILAIGAPLYVASSGDTRKTDDFIGQRLAK